jgi:hypothetical protein
MVRRLCDLKFMSARIRESHRKFLNIVDERLIANSLSEADWTTKRLTGNPEVGSAPCSIAFVSRQTSPNFVDDDSLILTNIS